MFLSRLKRSSRSFGVRLTAWILFLVCGVNLIDFGVSHRIISTALHTHDNEELLNELHEYSAAYRSSGLTGIAKKAEYEFRADGTLLLIVRLLSSDGTVLYSNDGAAPGPFDLSSLRSTAIDERAVIALTADTTPARLEVVRRRFEDGNELQLGDTTEDRDEILNSVDKGFGITFVPILLLTAVGGLVLARRALVPVRQLIVLLQSILQTGQLTVRAPLRGSGDELDSLSALFNSLLERISILVETMKHSLDNVAHDLRTPLTRFRGNAELALRESDPVQMRESLGSAIEESDRILATLHTLMDISEAEAGAMDLKIQPVALATLVERVISLYEFVAEEKGIKVTTRIPTNVLVRVDVDRMTQALANLLDNALKYTPAEGSVEFVAEQRNGSIQLSISDTGVGILPEDMPHIFERLYRGDKSRSSRGFGLGLSLVNAIVRAHGTSIHVVSTPDVGSTFRILLPQHANINKI